MRRTGWLGTALLCLGLGCSYEEVEGPMLPADALPADPVADLGAAPHWPRTYLLTLDAGAFPKTPDHPSALLYVPSSFVRTPSVSLVVYIHGFNNCVENIVRPTADGQPCKSGGAVRNAYNLIGQLEAAGRNALLLCPEVAFDRASSDPGQLGTINGFRTLLKEALAQVQTDLGRIDVDQLGPVVVASHSGGYAAAAGIAERGGVPISEVYLLDSLYGNSSDFETWMRSDLGSFSGSAPQRRFASIYTDGGGTLANSQALATVVRGFLPDPGVLVDDRTTATWPPATYGHGILFKRSALAHDAVPRYYFGTLLSTSSLAPQHPVLWAAVSSEIR